MLQPVMAGPPDQPAQGSQAAVPEPAPTWVLKKPADWTKMNSIYKPYQQKHAPLVNFANSNRMESLMRAGILYLSLQDAIALTLENNLDVELRRYTLPSADADLLRAKSGSLLQGIDTSITAGPATVGAGAQASAQAVGSSTATSGTNTVGGTFGGLQIQQIGASVPSYDPSITSSVNWFHQTNPVSSTFTTGTNFLIQDTNTANFQYRQGFTSGGQLTLGFNNFGLTENTPYDRNQLNPSRTGSISFSFAQPLLQGWGIALNKRFITIANNNRRISTLVFKQQVIEAVSAVIRLYWDLVALREQVKVQQQAVELAQKLLSDNQKQVEIGTLAPIEIVRAESQLATSQQQLITAETNVLQQETILKNALSRTGLASPTVVDARIVPTDRMQISDSEPMLPKQDLVNLAFGSRPEIQQTGISLETARLQIKGNKSALLPQLTGFVAATNNGLVGSINQNPALGGVGSFVPPPDPFFIGGYSDLLGQMFRRNFPNYGAGFQLLIPLRNRNAQANLIQSELTYRQQEIQQRQQENQIRLDVQNAIIAVTQARAQYQAAVKSRVLNEQTLDAEQKKYALGASTIFLVIQAQRDLAQARSVEVTALSTFSNAQVQLNRATGQILEKYHINLDEATAGLVSMPPSQLPAEDIKP